MKVPGPADHGYLIIDQRRLGAPHRPGVETSMAELVAQGWRRFGGIDDIDILVGPRSRLTVRQVGRRHFLIGTWRGGSASLASLIARSAGPESLARAVLSEGWGRYILAWRDDTGALAILRDPSGALDCLWWRHGRAVLVMQEPPRALDRLMPPSIDIDWKVLGEIAAAPELLGDRPALIGLAGLTPGALARFGDADEIVSVWRPADFCEARQGWDESHGALRAVIDATVTALVEPHPRISAEISGGLDSAIAASSLKTTGLSDRAGFVNFYGDWREGDERPYALAAANHLGVDLTCIRKPVEAITLRQLSPLGESVRPALQGVDVAYDQEVAVRMRRRRATALVTGQGGDAVFFQAPDPSVVIDRRQREGLSGLSPTFLASVGRWTRHSAWTLLGRALALTGDIPRGGAGRRHPWLEAVDDLPPAKAGQLRQFVNAQLFWGDCLRARSGDLLHPFLSQPVAEHCLAIPTDRLIEGVRDRGLARRAFASRLPPLLTERRSKGDLSCFYGQVTRASLPTLRSLLLEGLLVREGLLEQTSLEGELTEARLIASPHYNRLLVSAVLEVWARGWQARIADIRRAQIAIEPL